MYVFLDDIVIYANTLEEHEEKVNKVFERLSEAGLRLQIDKCQFLKPEIIYLGHIIDKKGVRPDPSKISAVKEFPAPTNQTEIRKFLGLAG